MLPAHKKLRKDALFQASVNKLVKEHVKEKMEKGHIRRWSYEVGFKKFSEKPEFSVIYNYFKSNIADVLANEGWKYKNCLIFI